LRGGAILVGGGADSVCGVTAEEGTANDADRLRKYLARFGLDFKTLSQKQL
jgi:sigma54-dependent transcription regulator